MPGAAGYGPAGKWIHDRAHRIMDDGKTPKSIAYAIATQQGHAAGKSPKGFRTAEGVRTAKKKYDGPKGAYQKTAGLSENTVSALFDELSQIEKDAGLFGKIMLPLALASSLGGGAKVIKNFAAHKAPAAAVAKAPMVAKGMGGLTHAAQEIREFMP